jgi:hypothetical protein
MGPAGCEGGAQCVTRRAIHQLTLRSELCPKNSRNHFSFIFPSQAAELAEYTAKIALLEEARRRKENEVEEWQHRVSLHSRNPFHGAHLWWPPLVDGSGRGSSLGDSLHGEPWDLSLSFADASCTGEALSPKEWAQPCAFVQCAGVGLAEEQRPACSFPPLCSCHLSQP